jgi:hypothetical protein
MRFFRFLPRRWWNLRGWKTWWSYVHWRLETYGVYYPEGKFNWKAFGSLLKQIPSYRRWLGDFDNLRNKPSKAN